MALAQPTPISGKASTERLSAGQVLDIFTVPGPVGSFAVVNIYFGFNYSYNASNTITNTPVGILFGDKFKKNLFGGSIFAFTSNSGAAFANQTQDLIGVVLEAGDTLKLTRGTHDSNIEVTVNVNGLFYKAS